MKRIVVLFIVLGAIFLGSALGLNYSAAQKINQSEKPAVLPAITVGEPAVIYIPKIQVTASVESVGQDQEGKMDVPKTATDVGWYNLGPKAGEVGSAVFSGHLDDISGRPAVFWNLNNLNIGDEVLVTDQTGKQYKFTVVDKQSYPFDQFPLKKVFNTNDKPRVNLITCEGVWNAASRNYSNRLVVFAELKT